MPQVAWVPWWASVVPTTHPHQNEDQKTKNEDHRARNSGSDRLQQSGRAVGDVQVLPFDSEEGRKVDERRASSAEFAVEPIEDQAGSLPGTVRGWRSSPRSP